MLLKNKKFIVIAGGALALVLIVLLLIFLLSHKKTFPLNPPGTVGNTACNLYNNGLFVELNGEVYFSNTYDNNSLYKMTSSEGNIEKLSNVIVRNLLGAGDYLYFFQNGTSGKGGFENVTNTKGFNRFKTDGTSIENFTKDIVVHSQLVDNYLYLMSTGEEGNRLTKIKIDKTETVDLGENLINPSCAYNGNIYYAGETFDHALHAFSVNDDIPKIILQEDVWYPSIQGEYVYYLDVAHNYKLARTSLTTGIKETLTEDRVDCYNIGGGWIYYQKNSAKSPALKKMRVDGTEASVIAEGNYTHINMTSNYVYFQEFGNDVTMYHCFLGTDLYSVFTGAMQNMYLNQ